MAVDDRVDYFPGRPKSGADHGSKADGERSNLSGIRILFAFLSDFFSHRIRLCFIDA